MVATIDDAALMRRQRLFLEEVERSIRQANREILHGQIPELDQKSFVDLARQVAERRARYLQVALLTKDETGPETTATLREHREAYEESRDAFDALQRAIERGYVDIGLSR